MNVLSEQKRLAEITDAEAAALRASGQFDPSWYLAEYPDVARTGLDPAVHFLWIGKRLGRFGCKTDCERARGIGLSWCIVATPHVLFIAHSLAEGLRRHGWTVSITLEMPEYFTDDHYIVLCAQMFNRLPPGEKRIIYQLEQSASSRWFSDQYLSDMNNSFAVMEYSLQNIEFLVGKGIVYPQVYYMPIGALPSYAGALPTTKDIDILFYGDYKSCPRRQRLLDWAETRFKVVRADTVFGDDIKALIGRSRMVLNLHYYEGAQLEMPRIQECLSLGTPVVSETTSDQGDYPDLGGVTFFEAGNSEAMMAAIAAVLHDPQAAAQGVRAAAQAWHRRHLFMLDRFLIGTGILPTEALDQMVTEPVTDGALYALSLPETIERRRVFDAETRTPTTQVFDGIRRRPGWIGCGMSYKYLCQSALKAGVKQFTIIEDDALLSAQHDAKMKTVLRYLAAHEGEWDIFSGVIANLHEDTKVLNVRSFEGLEFITINKMTSTVFNIYSSNALRKIAAWNQNDDNAQTNTIDRYLEHSGLRIVTTDPYIVGHREELHSTLWGFQNTQYRDMIAESERTLSSLKLAWQRSPALLRR
jgi:hypothetical protein